MNKRFIPISRQEFAKQAPTARRIKSLPLFHPKIRADFYVRLFSFLEIQPEINFEGFDFFVKEIKLNKVFSAAFTGFGPGYFAKAIDDESSQMIEEFDELIFSPNLPLKECRLEMEHDFGKTVLGFANGELIETDIPKE